MPSVFDEACFRIPVSDVDIAERPAPETDYRTAVLDRLTSLKGKRASYPNTVLEAVSSPLGRLVGRVRSHPFVAALTLAYAEHRPLRLSPDMIWLLICQGVAQHIRANAEELRHHFVSHTGRQELMVTVDRERLHPGSPENPWPEAVELFVREISAQTKNRHDWFAADFSTTGTIEKTATGIVLMEAFEPYFKYALGRVICGIPIIALEGTRDDWQKMIARTEAFTELGLNWWIDPLCSILQQFLRASHGDVDSHFWNSIFRIYQPTVPCSQRTSLGWFTMFFPYSLSVGRREWAFRSHWFSEPKILRQMLNPQKTICRLGGERFSGCADDFLPSGLSSAPIQWQDRTPDGTLVRAMPMELIAGFVGIRQNQQTMFLRPEIGWLVRRHSSVLTPGES